jgi:hypothetical protein
VPTVRSWCSRGVRRIWPKVLHIPDILNLQSGPVSFPRIGNRTRISCLAAFPPPTDQSNPNQRLHRMPNRHAQAALGTPHSGKGNKRQAHAHLNSRPGRFVFSAVLPRGSTILTITMHADLSCHNSHELPAVTSTVYSLVCSTHKSRSVAGEYPTSAAKAWPGVERQETSNRSRSVARRNRHRSISNLGSGSKDERRRRRLGATTQEK